MRKTAENEFAVLVYIDLACFCNTQRRVQVALAARIVFETAFA